MHCCTIIGIVVAAIAVVAAVAVYVCSDKVPAMDLSGKNVLITGGSSGIGLATAKEMIKRGANSVAIIARTQKTLDDAQESLQSFAKSISSNATVYTCSADVSKEEDMLQAVAKYTALVRKVDIVVASAGVTHPNYFSSLPVSEFERLMRINFIGAVVTAKAIIPHFQAVDGGRIVFVSSMAGLAGIHGYSAYAPSKYAVRGLAECLSMELKPYNIVISVCNPPDVDTPMYAEENKTKPEECKLISEGTGVFPAVDLANDICNGIENYKYLIQTGFDGFMIGNLTAGFGPSGGFVEAITQVVLMSPMRLVALVYRHMYDRICIDVHAKKLKKNQ